FLKGPSSDWVAGTAVEVRTAEADPSLVRLKFSKAHSSEFYKAVIGGVDPAVRGPSMVPFFTLRDGYLSRNHNQSRKACRSPGQTPSGKPQRVRTRVFPTAEGLEARMVMSALVMTDKPDYFPG